MDQIHKFIFFTGAIETLSYFSRQILVHFKERGYDTFVIDMMHTEEVEKRLKKFCKPGETAMITFNYIGLSGETAFLETNGTTIWESMQVKCLNLLVDHPLYYHKNLCKPHKDMVLFCLDRQHVEFVKEFYPETEVQFLPTAGNILLPENGEWKEAVAYRENLVPYGKREMDVVFIGNYAPLPDLASQFPTQTKEYIDYYYRIIDDMISRPKMSLHKALIKNLKDEMGELSVEDLKTGMEALVFLDLYVRTYFRAKTIKVLAEGGIKIHLFGKDWDKLNCGKSENLIWSGGQVDSVACVKAVCNSRICLNTMPWFKDGAHDRVFTAMLNGSVALTDDSIYLREQLTDGKELLFYELEQLERLPELAGELLHNVGLAEKITKQAYESAWQKHTWEKRAQKLEAVLNQWQ